MAEMSFDEFLPADFEARAREEATRGRVPFVVMRPDKGPASPPQPIAVVFAPAVPRVGEQLLWENGEFYAVIGVTHRMVSDADAPYLTALPLVHTRPNGRDGPR